MKFSWKNTNNWKKSAKNTAWCLLGCAIGDFGTIAYFQSIDHDLSTMSVMTLAIINGLITSIILETIILLRASFTFKEAVRTAFGMSFISMIGMEIAMNSTDYLLTGGAILTWWVIPPALFMGFITPWPYNYWRLEKMGKSCH